MNDTIERAKSAIEAVAAQEPREGTLTKKLEFQTGKIPSGFFLALGLASIAASAGLAISGERYKRSASFIGLWAPTILILGLYNKLVKLHGSDRFDETGTR